MKRALLAVLCLSLLAQARADRLYLRSTTDSIIVDGDDVVARVLSETRGGSVVSYTKSSVNGPVGTLGASDQFTINTSGNEKFSWTTSPLAAMTVSGSLTLQLTGAESSTAANATLTAEVLLLNAAGGIISTIAPAKRANVELGTTTTVINWTSPSYVTNVAAGNRIAVRVYGDDAQGQTQSSGKTLTLRVNGPNPNASGDSWLDIQQAISETTVTVTQTYTVSASPTQSATKTPTPTASPTFTITPTATDSPTATFSTTSTFTITLTPTMTPDTVLRRGHLLATLASVSDSTSCAANNQLAPTSAGYSIVVTSITARTTSSTSHVLTVYGDNAACAGTILANFNALGVEVVSGSDPQETVWVGGKKLAADAKVAFKTGVDVAGTDRVDVYGYELNVNGEYFAQ